MRILLKLSGEQLGFEGKSSELGSAEQNSALPTSAEKTVGCLSRGFDVERAKWIAGEVRQTLANALSNGPTQIIIQVGGGNLIRGAFFENAPEINPATAHNAGIMATCINAILLGDVFAAAGIDTAVLLRTQVAQMGDYYTYRHASGYIDAGKVLIIGGSDVRFMSTDTGAVNLALELGCDLVAKATKVDGVYTDDPTTNPDAQKIDQISYEQAINDAKVRVMDKAALGMAGDNRLPIVVFELLKDGNIARVAAGEQIGTRIS